jgi:hypothetical protein
MHRLNLWQWRVTTTQAIVGFGLLAMFWKSLPPEVPLFYSRPWGQDQLVSPYFLWTVPLLGTALGLLGGFISQRVTTDKVLRGILIGSILVIQIILILGLIRIVLVVT